MSDDLTDARLEREITLAQAKLDACWLAKDSAGATLALFNLTNLVYQRSPEQITRMERDRGLE